MKIKILISKLKYRKLYKQYKDRKNGKPICDFEKGCGYYLPLGIIFAKIKGREETWDMKSGKKMKVKLIDYQAYSDPSDMTEWSKWQFLGYEGEKLYTEMSWLEYLQIYLNTNK